MSSPPNPPKCRVTEQLGSPVKKHRPSKKEVPKENFLSSSSETDRSRNASSSTSCEDSTSDVEKQRWALFEKINAHAAKGNRVTSEQFWSYWNSLDNLPDAEIDEQSTSEGYKPPEYYSFTESNIADDFEMQYWGGKVSDYPPTFSDNEKEACSQGGRDATDDGSHNFESEAQPASLPRDRMFPDWLWHDTITHKLNEGEWHNEGSYASPTFSFPYYSWPEAGKYNDNGNNANDPTPTQSAPLDLITIDALPEGHVITLEEVRLFWKRVEQTNAIHIYEFLKNRGIQPPVPIVFTAEGLETEAQTPDASSLSCSGWEQWEQEGSDGTSFSSGDDEEDKDEEEWDELRGYSVETTDDDDNDDDNDNDIAFDTEPHAASLSSIFSFGSKGEWDK